MMLFSKYTVISVENYSKNNIQLSLLELRSFLGMPIRRPVSVTAPAQQANTRKYEPSMSTIYQASKISTTYTFIHA
jgi:hypothetical protein